MKIRVMVIIVFLLAGPSVPGLVRVLAAQTSSQPAEPATGQQEVDSLSALYTLRVIDESIEALRSEIRNKESELPGATTEQGKKQAIDDLNELARRLEAARKRFETVATGIDPGTYTSKSGPSFDIVQEMKELLAPMIQQLKQMTARPREIEAFRNQAATYQAQADAAEKAVQSITRLLEKTENPGVKARLKTLLDSWTAKAREAGSQSAVARLQLEDKLKDEQSVWQSLQNAVRDFFRSKGLNLVLSIAAFIVALIAFRFVRRGIWRFFPSLTASRRSFAVRLGEFLYRVAMFACATLAFIITLYLMEDWALLGVAILFLLSLAWTAKQALPKFYQHYRLMLNLGNVKEGERLTCNGIPWHVVSLGLLAKLENPELSGGTITLPLSALAGMASRPGARDEPWFPCRVNDWVVLNDGTRGKVLVQTPESVQLVLLGGSRKSYPTAEFLRQNPTNISIGFRVSSTFGVDYRHQAEAPREIPRRLMETLQEGLALEPFGKDILSVQVEFNGAGPSSLDLMILVNLSGHAARHYEEIHRAIQRICVEASNRCGWTIPFPQLAIHRAES